MHNHVISPLKSLSAQITNVRLFGRMRDQMRVSHMRRPEAFFTDVAHVRLHTCMCRRVIGQVSLRGKRLTALFTVVSFTVLLHMIVQILLRQELLVAHVAVKLVLVQVRDFPVFVQGVIARVESTANVAHMLKAVVRAEMELEIPFYLEALAAMLASESILVGMSPNVMRFQIAFGSTAIVAFIATVQRAGIHLLMNEPVHLQVALVFETFAANCALERTMKTVFARDMAQNFTLLLIYYLTNITYIMSSNEFLVECIFFCTRFVDM